MSIVRLGKICSPISRTILTNSFYESTIPCGCFSPRSIYCYASRDIYRSSHHQNEIKKELSALSLENYKSYSSSSSKKNIDNESVTSKLFSVGNNIGKLTNDISMDIKLKKRVYKNDFLRLFDYLRDVKSADSQQISLLFACCSNALPDVTPAERIKLLYDVWNGMREIVTFNINNYHEILQSFIENGHKFVARKFIEDMLPLKPNEMTYNYLLSAVCEVGDMNQAIEIMSNMKASNIPLTNRSFNSLIECYGKTNNMKNAKEVIKTMKSLIIAPTIETQVSLIKASIWSNSMNDLMNYLMEAKQNGTPFTERQVLDIVKCMVQNQFDLVPMALELLPRQTDAVEISPLAYSVCVQLIYEGYPEMAYIIYKKMPYVNSNFIDQNVYCRKFLRECIKAGVSTSVVDKIALDLIEKNLNVFALQVLCEATLQIGNTESATHLLKLMKEQGSSLRCHYFWPLFIQSSNVTGEKGIFDIILLMKNLDVEPDYETINEYILPHVNKTSTQTLMKKFISNGLKTSTILTPTVVSILKEGKLRDASDLCEIYYSDLDSKYLITPLVQCFNQTGDIDSLIRILDAMYNRSMETGKDWVGMFLKTMLSRHWKNDVINFEKILKEILKLNIGISGSICDICVSYIEHLQMNYDYTEEIKDLLRLARLKYTKEEKESYSLNIPQQKDMTLQQLESHLIELESKKMNPRGVLRKLLQEYCRLGKIKEALDILNKCEKEKIQMSAGMIASIVDLHVKCNDLEKAEHYFAQLNKVNPNFLLDTHKILDFATLQVSNGRLKRAIKLLENYGQNCHIKGGKSIETNCWRLLYAVAKKGNVNDTQTVFTTLVTLGFCQPSNILLGPIIRCHLHNSDDAGAVNEFVETANKYRKTPLKHELLCRFLKLSNQNKDTSESKNNNETEIYKKYVKQILEVDRKIHGTNSSQLSLVTALADTGLSKQLRRYVLEPSVVLNQDSLLKQCQRLADEKKIFALETIAGSLDGIRNIHVNEIYEIILKVHSLNSDPSAGLSLWNKMQENNVKPTRPFIKILYGLLVFHKHEIPSDLIAYLDNDIKASVMDA